MGNKFWSFKNVAEEERELCINGVIAEESWFDDDVTPQLFKDELNSGKGNITLWINSPGGDCIAASQIYTMLKEYPCNVTVKIDGIAASAASVIAMAGDKVLMSPTSMLMIHNPMTMAAGDHNDMSKAIEVLNEIKESIINAYQLKTGKSRAKLSEMMEDETWMAAINAIKNGFADGMLGEEKEIEEPEEDEKPETDVDEPDKDDDKKMPSNWASFSQRKSNLKLVAKIADSYIEKDDDKPKNDNIGSLNVNIVPVIDEEKLEQAINKLEKLSPKSEDKEPKKEYSNIDIFRARLDVYKKSINK